MISVAPGQRVVFTRPSIKLCAEQAKHMMKIAVIASRWNMGALFRPRGIAQIENLGPAVCQKTFCSRHIPAQVHFSALSKIRFRIVTNGPRS